MSAYLIIWIKIGFYILFIFSVGCNRVGEPDLVYTIPIYKECLNKVQKFKQYLKGYKNLNYRYDLNIVKFNDISYSHSRIIGYVELLLYKGEEKNTSFTPEDAIKVNADSIKAACYPESRIIFDSFNISNSIIEKAIEKKGYLGGTYYTDFDDGSLTVWFNDGKYKLPKQ